MPYARSGRTFFSKQVRIPCCGINSNLALRRRAVWVSWKFMLSSVYRILCITIICSTMKAFIKAWWCLRPYPCQCYINIRWGCPTRDNKAGLVPVDAKNIIFNRLHKWLVGIWKKEFNILNTSQAETPFQIKCGPSQVVFWGNHVSSKIIQILVK